MVQAGTGTGKSLAYLIPAVLSGQRVVVATATKALQDQLAEHDLPLVAKAIDREISFAVLKGRSNYVCRERVHEVGGRDERDDQLSLQPTTSEPADADDGLRGRDADVVEDGRLADQVRRLLRWAEDTTTGDRAELEFEPHFRAWAMVSTTARECPGAFRCPSGQDCFAEDARARAAAADVVVVNTYLYGAHLASGGLVLPPHEVVVFDEAHEVEEVMTDSLGVEIGPGRFRALAATARPLLDPNTPGASDAADAVTEVADLFQRAIAPLSGKRIARDQILGLGEGGSAPVENQPDPPEQPDQPRYEPLGLELGIADLATEEKAKKPKTAKSAADKADQVPVASVLPADDESRLIQVMALASGRVSRLVDALRRSERAAGDDEPAAAWFRRDRVQLAAGHLAGDLARVTALTDDEVAWVDSGARSPSLRVSPIDVGPLLAEQLWETTTGVLTSATVPLALIPRLGLPPASSVELDVGSPFDYPHKSMLYVARGLPDRRRPESEPALHKELESLINAAGGRTLALFTSWRAMHEAVGALRDKLSMPILSQSDLPKSALIQAFSDDEPTCLFATLGFWQGVNVQVERSAW